MATYRSVLSSTSQPRTVSPDRYAGFALLYLVTSLRADLAALRAPRVIRAYLLHVMHPGLTGEPTTWGLRGRLALGVVLAILRLRAPDPCLT